METSDIKLLQSCSNNQIRCDSCDSVAEFKFKPKELTYTLDLCSKCYHLAVIGEYFQEMEEYFKKIQEKINILIDLDFSK